MFGHNNPQHDSLDIRDHLEQYWNTLSAYLNSYKTTLCLLQKVSISITETNISDYNKSGHCYVNILMVTGHAKQRQTYFT